MSIKSVQHKSIMEKYYRYIIILLIGFSSFLTYSQSLTVVTYNIRYDNPDDADNAWTYRKESIVELLQKYEPELFGLQEALFHQIQFIQNHLPDYTFFGYGRDDGELKGEFSPIFYHARRFSLLEGSVFWLSENPEMPGTIGWDAACPRIVTWVQLFDKVNNDTLYFFNTHFDHEGIDARNNSASLLLNSIENIAGNNNIILCGDFNCRPGSTTYEILLQPYKNILINDAITDYSNIKPDYTFIGFDYKGVSGDYIDYIFHSPNFQVELARILDDNKNGVYPSDHLPVLSKFKY